MKKWIAGFAFGIITAGQGVAQDDTSIDLFVEVTPDISLEAFAWTHRPIVVFANSPLDPRFQDQMELLQADTEALIERDIVVLTDTNPAMSSSIRTTLRPRDFSLVLIGKDGEVKLRKPFPWDTRELGRVIDKMPMRQREIQSSKN